MCSDIPDINDIRKSLFGRIYLSKSSGVKVDSFYEELRREFRKGFDEYIADLKVQTGKDYNHYQDLHAISVYLFFEYPEKYFIYKF